MIQKDIEAAMLFITGRSPTPARLRRLLAAADALVPLSDAEQLRAAGPSSELWVVHGAGHGGSYWADPQAYTARVAAFFERHLAPKGKA